MTARAPIAITSTCIGRTDLGESTALVDDDSMTVTVHAAAAERPIRVGVAAIDAVALEGPRLALTLHDGTRLTLMSHSAARLRDELLIRCHTLPEMTRTLRAFGSRRAQRGVRADAASDQQRFFAPLLEARRQAGAAGAPGPVIAAFDAAAMSDAISATLASFAADRHPKPGPERRALEAELADDAEPLLVAIHALGDAAARAAAALDDLRSWRVWSAQLCAMFEVADRVWITLDASLDASLDAGHSARA